MTTHSYLFFDPNPNIRELRGKDFDAHMQEFSSCIARATAVRVSFYTTLGLKAGSRFMLHVEANEASDIQQFVRDLLHTKVGECLTLAHSMLGLVRPSPYRPPSAGAKEIKEEAHPERRYLVVYPFTKTASWHLLPFEERREMMREHVGIGRTHSEHISQLLLYSYGIDDQEFIVSYECNSLLDFQTLVMELRATRGRGFTQSDMPIFTCVRATPTQALSML